MGHGELVVAEVEGLEAVLGKAPLEAGDVGAVVDRQADEDACPDGIGDTVVELGHVAAADQLAETPEGATLLGYRHGEDGFTPFADLRAFGHETQAVEIHVGAARHGHEGLALQPLAQGIGLGGRPLTALLPARGWSGCPRTRP